MGRHKKSKSSHLELCPLGFSANILFRNPDQKWQKKESDNEEEKKTQEATMRWQRAQASRSNNISLVDEGSIMVKRHCK